jgi:protein TonB
MNKHSKSLSFSIIIHTLLLASIFYIYHEFASAVGEKKEKRICIELGCITESTKTIVTSPKPHKKRVEAHKKPPVKKRHKPKPHIKKIPKKTVPLHKAKPIEKKSVLKPVVEEKIAQQKECKKVISACPDKMTHKETQVQQKRQKESVQSHYVNIHLATIAQLLQENLYYPRRARKRGIEGEVVVKFTLQKDAQVTDIKIISSQNDILSRGARKTLENLSGEFPRPEEALTLTVPITYSLH